MIVLAADVGGTHTRLALAEAAAGETQGAGAPAILRRARYGTQGAPSLATVVRGFLAAHPDLPPVRACFGVAGPVLAGHAQLTNVDWDLDTQRLGRAIGVADTRMINDFAAIGYAIPLLERDDLVELQAGTPRPRAPIAVIGAGTGLGHAYLLWERDRYQVHTSEAGHADFAPRTAREAALLAFLQGQHAHVSWERVLSGRGLAGIYEFLASRAAPAATGADAGPLAQPDPGPAITALALARSDDVAMEALDLFCELYGAQAANFALAIGALGGVYVAGGIALGILDALRAGGFISAFRAKGRLASVLATIAVRVIRREDAGLVGAASAASAERLTPPSGVGRQAY